MILRLDRVGIALIAQRLRTKAGLPEEPTGVVSDESAGLLEGLPGSVRS